MAGLMATGGFQLFSAGVSALGQISAGAAQKRQYQMQAEQAELRGRSEAIAYKQQGADALRNLNETLAAIISRAAAGGVDPTSGDSATLQQYALSEVAREKQIAQDNALWLSARQALRLEFINPLDAQRSYRLMYPPPVLSAKVHIGTDN